MTRTAEVSHGTCRICGGDVEEFLDLGQQPVSQRFRSPDDASEEFFFRLAAGRCTGCTMIQLIDEVPRDDMFHQDYPFVTSTSRHMSDHFTRTAQRFLETELSGEDPFMVEVGCNDGVLLRTVSAAGVRHLGFEPSGQVAQMAADAGVRVRTEFFEEASAAAVAREDGLADVVYGANTICHIPYLDSVFRGLDALLKPTGVFVFEDPYLGDIIEKSAFDQIYDEHFYYFSAQSVSAAVGRFGFELVDVERLPVHGGQVRYTVARSGARVPTAAVEELLAWEAQRGLTSVETLLAFSRNVAEIRTRLVDALQELRGAGQRVVGYAATAKSATVLNYCGIGPDLIDYVCDTTPAKQGLVTPGQRIPVRAHAEFTVEYPDVALLFAWNHGEEVMAKERDFVDAGGRWLRYVPEVLITDSATATAGAVGAYRKMHPRSCTSDAEPPAQQRE